MAATALHSVMIYSILVFSLHFTCYLLFDVVYHLCIAGHGDNIQCCTGSAEGEHSSRHSTSFFRSAHFVMLLFYFCLLI